MSNILIVLLAIIAFFFSIHSSILSQHDDKKDGLFWFNVWNIINFPIEQLEYNDNNYLNEIEIHEKNGTIPKFIFVIDKTLSTKGKIDSNIEKYINSIKDDLKDTKSACKPMDVNNSLIDMLLSENRPSDLLLVGCINQLHKLYGDNIKYEVLVYYGKEKNTEKQIDILPSEKPTDGFCSFLQEYKKIKRADNNHNTNFNKIVSELDNASYISKSDTAIVTVISDFFHEEETESFYTLDKSVYNLSKRNISHLNLIQLYGNEKNEIAAIEKTINLFEKYFKHIYLYKYEQRTILNEKQDDFSCYLSSIMQTSQQADNVKIKFYYPFMQGIFSEANKCEIKFPAGKYTLNIRNESTGKKTNNINITIKNKKTNSHFLLTDEHPIVERLGDDDATYELIMNTENIPHNCFLEISSETNRNKTQYPLVFKELVPKTICYVLILIYIWAGLLFAACMWFLWKKHSVCKHTEWVCWKANNRTKWYALILLILGLVLILGLIIYYIVNLISTNFVWIYIVFILVVLLLLIRFFRYENRILHDKKICRQGCIEEKIEELELKNNDLPIEGNNEQEDKGSRQDATKQE
ncbi:hypothetical protein FACS1894160_2810 [Bacteroidia bacterium]|nr:hypothetical protein FACS1894160_2810 [Bacteroidia bacterium]